MLFCSYYTNFRIWRRCIAYILFIIFSSPFEMKPWTRPRCYIKESSQCKYHNISTDIRYEFTMYKIIKYSNEIVTRAAKISIRRNLPRILLLFSHRPWTLFCSISNHRNNVPIINNNYTICICVHVMRMY